MKNSRDSLGAKGLRVLSWLVRVAVLPIHISLVWLKQLEQKLEPPRYQIHGSCQNNGACCERLFLQEGPYLSWPILRHLTHFWMTKIYPFEFHDHSMLHANDEQFYRMVTCRNLVDGKCREYWLRPRLCRVWPIGDDERPPILFKGCGYWSTDQQAPEAGDVSHRKPSYKRADRMKLIAEWTQAPKRTSQEQAKKEEDSNSMASE